MGMAKAVSGEVRQVEIDRIFVTPRTQSQVFLLHLYHITLTFAVTVLIVQ